MSVIVYRDGVMAADSSAWQHGWKHRWSRKIVRGCDGTLYGVLGEVAEGQTFLRWAEAGCKGDMPQPREVDPKDETGSFNAIIVRPDGLIDLLLKPYGLERYDAPYYAIGGAAEVAWGALYAGASAMAAVKAAIEHSDRAAGVVMAISRDG